MPPACSGHPRGHPQRRAHLTRERSESWGFLWSGSRPEPHQPHWAWLLDSRPAPQGRGRGGHRVAGPGCPGGFAWSPQAQWPDPTSGRPLVLVHRADLRQDPPPSHIPRMAPDSPVPQPWSPWTGSTGPTLTNWGQH